jgi:probable rRNA maturation factor
MIEVEVFGLAGTARAPSLDEVRDLCVKAAASRGVAAGHVAVEFLDVERITQLNREHRGKDEPTDVLSDLPYELGDIVICPAHTVDLREAIIHGMLHLLGMDHERDHGEMLALQDELLAAAR